MIEVFITDIQSKIQADSLISTFQIKKPYLRINYDLNETGLPFPCGHTILRVEGNKINSHKILVAVRDLGFKCEILEDKICTQKEKL